MYFQALLGGIVFLGLVFLYNQRSYKKIRGSVRDHRDVTRNINEIENLQSQLPSSTHDVIIVGAGLVGSALAFALGKDGRRVHIIRTDIMNESDEIVGELLQPGGFLKLIELGLEGCMEEIDAQTIYGYAIIRHGKVTTLPYPLANNDSMITGRSFHNGWLIHRIREKAESLSNVTLDQGTITSLLEEKGRIRGVQYRYTTGEELVARAPLTIICDGSFSRLQPSFSDVQVDIPSNNYVALLLKNCDLPNSNYGHVILADPSPIFFYRISSTEIRCLVDIPDQLLPSISKGELSQYMKSVVLQQVPSDLRTAFLYAIEKGNIRIMEKRSMPTSTYPIPGAICLRDAFQNRNPVSGGGMTIALSDIILLRDILRPHDNLHHVSAIYKHLKSFYMTP